MKLIVDMNLSPLWVDYLNEAGISAVHWSSIGEPDAPDAQIMQYAQTNEMIVLTHDLDFGGILAMTKLRRPSVVQIRAIRLSPKEIGRQVVRSLKQMEIELEKGALLTINLERTRLRLLPL